MTRLVGMNCTVASRLRHFRSPPLHSVSHRKIVSIVVKASMRIDSHLHVWATAEESLAFPYKDEESKPQVQGNTSYLLGLMDEVGVDMAMIVQSSTHGFDHSYVKKAMDDYPNRFLGCLLANPADNGIGVVEMERLVKEDGFKCVRFNPYIWPDGQKMTNQIGHALFQKAGELGVPVGFMLLQGLMNHIEEVEVLCSAYPQTKVILDHFGFSKRDPEAWEKLLDLAKYPQVYIKSSAFFRNSTMEFPYLDLRSDLRRLVDTYSPQRVLWGTDFPWVIPQCGYAGGWSIVQEGDKQTGESLLTEEETNWLEGGSAEILFMF